MGKAELRVFGVVLLLLLAASEALLAYNTLYTEGEVVQGLYLMLVGIDIPILGLILSRPKAGIWCALGLGFLLLPWQTYKNRKLAILHEEVVEIVSYVEKAKEANGSYAGSLESYNFKTAWTPNHIEYSSEGQQFRLLYFLDDRGISYWYDSKTGFGYYPD